jgi:hypothetical protein
MPDFAAAQSCLRAGQRTAVHLYGRVLNPLSRVHLRSLANHLLQALPNARNGLSDSSVNGHRSRAALSKPRLRL